MPQVLRGDQQAKNRKLHKLATSFDIVQYACFLKDVFFHLCNLSNTLQKKDVSLAQVHSALQVTRAVLVKFKERDGSTLQRLNNEPEFEEVRLQSAGSASSFQSSRRKLLEGLLSSLDNQFDDIDCGVLKATAIADISSWPHKDNMEDFGDSHLKSLCQQFRPALQQARVGTEEALVEWTSLKTIIYELPDWEEQQQILEWAEVNRRWEKGHSTFLAIIDLGPYARQSV